MRVFITGATGYIGSAVAAALHERGHDVAALVRPETDSKALRDLGVVIVAGDLASLPTLADSFGSYDAILHIAQSNSADAPALNKVALDVVRRLETKQRVDVGIRSGLQQRVAIRRRPRDRLQRDVSAGAGTVVDDDRLSEPP